VYDLILVDLFKAEEQPAYVITLESLDKIKKMLSQGAYLVINWHGYSSGEKGRGTAILVNTLKEKGFKFSFAAVSDNEDARNLLIFACLSGSVILSQEVSLALPHTQLLNTDNHPVLEKYNALANQSWRKNYIQYYYSGR